MTLLLSWNFFRCVVCVAQIEEDEDDGGNNLANHARKKVTEVLFSNLL